MNALAHKPPNASSKPSAAAIARFPHKEPISGSAPLISKARSLTAKARTHFNGSSVIGANPSLSGGCIGDIDAHFSSPENIGRVDAALTDCHLAIKAWLRAIPMLKPDSRGIFEACLSLGELYSKRSKLIDWNSVRAFSKKSTFLLAQLRSLEAMKISRSYIEKAMRCKVQPALPELEVQPLKARLMWVHESLSYCYTGVSGAYLRSGDGEKAEKAAQLDKKHGEMRSKLGEQLYF